MTHVWRRRRREHELAISMPDWDDLQPCAARDGYQVEEGRVPLPPLLLLLSYSVHGRDSSKTGETGLDAITEVPLVRAATVHRRRSEEPAARLVGAAGVTVLLAPTAHAAATHKTGKETVCREQAAGAAGETRSPDQPARRISHVESRCS